MDKVSLLVTKGNLNTAEYCSLKFGLCANNDPSTEHTSIWAPSPPECLNSRISLPLPIKASVQECVADGPQLSVSK